MTHFLTKNLLYIFGGVFVFFVLLLVIILSFPTSEKIDSVLELKESNNQNNEKELIEETTEEEKEVDKSSFSIIFVGDIMLDRGVLHYTEKFGDYRFPFLKIKERLSKADLRFGNLESVISDKGFDQGGPYSFRAPIEMIEGLTYADFNVLSLANNHSFDWTVEALMDTKERLKSEEIIPVGAGTKAYSPVFLEKEDTMIAFLAYTAVGSPGWASTEFVPGVAWYTDEMLERGIKEAKEENSDIIIVSIHYGQEYRKKPNQEQIRISKKAIDLGADLVIGHHPHVIQPVEEYKDGIIAYSLGNFIFDQSFSEETMEGLLLEVFFEDKKIKNYQKEIIKLNQYFQPDPSL